MFLWLEEIWAMPRNLIYFKGASLVTSKCKMTPGQAPPFVLPVVQAPSTVEGELFPELVWSDHRRGTAH